MKVFFTICLTVIIGFIISLTAFEYWETTHRTHFNIEDKYKINLFSDECGLCYLDWQVKFKIKITDLETNEKYKYKFWMGDGPSIEFGIPKDGKKQILIRGYEYNGSPGRWLIDFDRNEIDETSTFSGIQDEEYIFVKKLNNKFEITRN